MIEVVTIPTPGLELEEPMTEQPRAHRRGRGVLCLLAAAALLGACRFGGGDPVPPAASETLPADPPPTTAATAPAAVPTDAATDPVAESAPDVPRADRRTTRLAKEGRLRRGDFPTGWAVRTPAAPIDMEANRASCSYRQGGPEAALRRGAIAQGPHLQLDDAPGYVHSQVYVFADETAAAEWVTYIDGDEWARCTRRQLQQFQDDQDAGSRIRSPSRDADALGEGGFVSYASFPLANEDGDIVAYTDFQFYRLGRVVIRLGLDIGSLTAAQYDAYTAGIDQALPEAYNRIFAVEPAEAGT